MRAGLAAASHPNYNASMAAVPAASAAAAADAQAAF